MVKMNINKSKKVTKCLLCGNTIFADLGISKCPILSSKYHLRKCSKCKLVFVDPSPDELELSKIYSTEYRLGYTSWVKYFLKLYNTLVFQTDVNFIKKYIWEGNVVDLGYGSGEMLNALGEGWKKFGFDPYSKKEDRHFLKIAYKIETVSDES